jgi:hypothetical protein
MADTKDLKQQIEPHVQEWCRLAFGEPGDGEPGDRRNVTQVYHVHAVPGAIRWLAQSERSSATRASRRRSSSNPWLRSFILGQWARRRAQKRGLCASRPDTFLSLCRYHGSGPASLKTLPVGPSSGSIARRTGVAAPCSTVLSPRC